MTATKYLSPAEVGEPLSGPRSTQNRQACVDYVLEHPWWRLSLQTHKLLGIP